MNTFDAIHLFSPQAPFRKQQTSIRFLSPGILKKISEVKEEENEKKEREGERVRARSKKEKVKEKSQKQPKKTCHHHPTAKENVYISQSFCSVFKFIVD